MFEDHSVDTTEGEMRACLELLTNDDVAELLEEIELTRSLGDGPSDMGDGRPMDSEPRWELRAFLSRALDRFVGSVRSDFFVRLAGTDPKALDESNERLAYTMLGVSLLAPLIIATLGMTALLHLAIGATDRFEPWYLVLGLGWGVVVVIVQRLLLRPRQDAFDLRTGPRRSKLSSGKQAASTLVQLGIVVALAFVVAQPLVTMLFTADIDRVVAEEQAAVFGAEREAAILAIEARREADVERLEVAAQRQIAEVEIDIDRLQVEIARAQTAHDEQVRLCQQEQVDGNGQGRGGGFGPVATRLCAQVSGLEDMLTAIKETNDPQIAELQDRLVTVDQPVEAVIQSVADEIAALPTEPSPTEIGLWERTERVASVTDRASLLSLQGLVILLHSLPLVIRLVWGRRAHDEILRLRASEALTAQIVEGERYLNLTQARLGLNDGLSGQYLDDDIDAMDDDEDSFEVIAVDDRVLLITDDLRLQGSHSLLRSARILTRQAGDRQLEHGVVVKSALDSAAQLLDEEIDVFEQISNSVSLAVRSLVVTSAGGPNHPALVTEYHPRTSLDRWLPDLQTHTGHDIPVRMVLRWLHNIVDALEQLWECDLVHGDGQPSHLLVVGAPGFDVDLGDLGGPSAPGSLLFCGLSGARSVGSTPTVVTAYSPPEYRADAPLSRLGDVYSFLGATGQWIIHRARPGDPCRNSAPEPLQELLDRWLEEEPVDRVSGHQPCAPTAVLTKLLREQIDRASDELSIQGQIDHLVDGTMV